MTQTVSLPTQHTPLLLEVHILQNHSPSNLNRDDTGSPKQCVFGLVRRGRISSQCLKRTIRRSDLFQGALEGHLGIRTRQLPELVRKAFLADEKLAPLAEIAARKTTGFGTKEGKEQDAKNGKYLTAQSMFLAQADIEAVTQAVMKAAEGKTEKTFAAVKASEIQGQAISRGFRAISVDVALFGRMVTDDAIRDVEAACQVAHALSTHRVEEEFDYFTAVDDLQGADESEREEDSGADMIGDVEFNSATYYKYFSIDVDGLIDNLVGRGLQKDISQQDEQQARELVGNAVAAMIEAAVTIAPSGKQNTFASHTRPSAVLVEARPVKTPLSYANAFVDPVQPRSTGGGLVGESIKKFADHVEKLTEAYDLQATQRLWFAPEHDRNVEGTIRITKLSDLIARIREAVNGNAHPTAEA
jgi:CRISPR system Cascade subunit CasC